MEKNYTFKGGITKYWWIPVITGILSIAIGIWCLCSPAESLTVLAYVFAAALCVTGVFNLTFAGVNSKLFPGWGWPLMMGLLELICGIWMLSMPTPQLVTVFIYAVGLYLIFAAVSAISDACTGYGYSSDWFGWMIAILLITLLFAVIFLAGPIAGGVAVWIYIGISFITFGLYRLILAAKIRKLNRTIRF